MSKAQEPTHKVGTVRLTLPEVSRLGWKINVGEKHTSLISRGANAELKWFTTLTPGGCFIKLFTGAMSASALVLSP